jgi:hypothetical protein
VSDADLSFRTAMSIQPSSDDDDTPTSLSGSILLYNEKTE